MTHPKRETVVPALAAPDGGKVVTAYLEHATTNATIFGTQAADLVLAGEPRAANLADQCGVPWMPESLE